MAAPTTASSAAGHQESAADEDSQFTCNICLEQPTDPVITLCGHLFCWSCLYRWLESRPQGLCPCCKAGVTKENVIPLYGRGGSQADPRGKTPAKDGESIPGRPRAQRPEPQATGFGGNGNAVNFGGGTFLFSAGMGFFPSLFGLQFQRFPPARNPNQAAEMSPEERNQEMLSRLLLILGSVVILCLLLF